MRTCNAAKQGHAQAVQAMSLEKHGTRQLTEAISKVQQAFLLKMLSAACASGEPQLVNYQAEHSKTQKHANMRE